MTGWAGYRPAIVEASLRVSGLLAPKFLGDLFSHHCEVCFGEMGSGRHYCSPACLGRMQAMLRNDPQPGHLLVTCWCERIVMDVPTLEMHRGQTRSCGAPECRMPMRERVA